jgi:diguanylate cyclase (GGDEF)-like protein
MSETSVPARHHPMQSLVTRIVAVVFLASFLTALVVSWVSVHSTYDFLRRQVDHSYPALLQGAAERVEQWLAGGLEALDRTAADPALRRALTAPPDRRAALHALEAVLAQQTHFEVLLLRDAEGALVAAAGAAIDPEHLAPGVPRESGILPVDLGEGSVRPAAGSLVAIPGGAVLGHLQGVFRTDVLEQELRLPALGPHARIHVLDAQGRVRAGPELASERAERTFAEPGAGTAIYRSGAGDIVVGVSHAIGSWQLVLEQPFREAFEPVFSVVTRVFVIDLCIILLFSFLAYQVTSSFVGPIEALSEGARRISEGRLGVEIPEPPAQDEVGLLTRTFNDMARKLMRNQKEIHETHAELKQRNDELQRANEVLEQLSITDGLTKLHNHRFFQEFLTREIKRVSRTREPLSMLIIDIDDFKRLNDRLGHAAGDELLVRIARILNDSIRETDFVARYGGEEFVVVAPDTDLHGAVALAEKIRTAIAESSFILDGSLQLTKMTVSVGVAQYQGNRKTFFHAADQALYRAKASGKGCVVADEGDDPSVYPPRA